MYSIPFYFCTGFEDVAAKVLVFVDAAAEEVCGESCAAHCCIWLIGIGWEWEWDSWRVELSWLLVGELIVGFERRALV
jgi:hypothetical protein